MFSAQRFAPLGYQQITGLATAKSLTVPANATLAIIKASTQACRWRDDGTAPTGSVGVPMLTTDPPLEYSGNLAKFQIIEQSSAAVVDVSYYQAVG